MMRRCAGSISLLVTLAAAAFACQVPVFRFALERWEADDYRIVVFEKGPRTADTEALIDRLQRASRQNEDSRGTSNILIEVADVDNLTEAQQWSLLGWEELEIFPAMQVYYPESTGVETALWQGGLSNATVSALLASPVRTKLVERLTTGDSAVWIVVKSGDVVADSAAREKLQASLDSAEASLQIPEGVIRPEELEEAINSRDVPVEMDDVLRSRIPLKIAFSVLELDPEDPAEAIFSRMLLHADTGSSPVREPLAIPVFGRGRMMPGVPASRFSENTIAAAAGYLCGACSCQVKEQNPGRDLLVGTDWSKHLQDGLIVTERELPPLTGAGDVASVQSGESETSASKSAERTEPRSFDPTTLLVALGAVTVVIVVGTLMLARIK